MAGLILLSPASPPSSSPSFCYSGGGCISDYIAVALTAAVAFMIIAGTILLITKSGVPEIKAKQIELLVTQSIGSLVWLTSLLMTRNILKLPQRKSFWDSCNLWQIWLEGPFGFGLLMSCYIARAFRLYHVFVGRRLPPIRSVRLVPFLLMPWIIVAAILQGLKPFATANECKAPLYIWVVIGSMHILYSLSLIVHTWLIRNIRFEFNEFIELLTGVSIGLIFLAIWSIIYIVKHVESKTHVTMEVVARFSLVILADVVAMCFFWVPVARPLWAYTTRERVLRGGVFDLDNDYSMGQALGVPKSGLLAPPAMRFSFDEPLESLLQHKRFRLSFLAFAESRMAGETVHFYDEVRELNKLPASNPDRRVYMADHIINRYIMFGSPCEINISYPMRSAILNTKDLASQNLFKQAADEAVNMMQMNLLKEYWQSSYFLKLKEEIDAEAEYSAQLERMSIRDIPLRQIKGSPYDFVGSDDPFDQTQPNSLPPSGPLHYKVAEAGVPRGNSSLASYGNVPPWEVEVDNLYTPLPLSPPPANQLQKATLSAAEVELDSCQSDGPSQNLQTAAINGSGQPHVSLCQPSATTDPLDREQRSNSKSAAITDNLNPFHTMAISKESHIP